jgi:hypothetical protein
MTDIGVEGSNGDRAIGRDWIGELLKENSWNRMAAFIKVAHIMTVAELRETLAFIWTICDGVWRWREILIVYFRKAGYLGDRPAPTEPLTVYRGVKEPRHRLGLGWSTSLLVARSFPARSRMGRGRRAYVYSATVTPEGVLAGFDERSEAEYVVDPAYLSNLRLVESFDWRERLADERAPCARR